MTESKKKPAAKDAGRNVLPFLGLCCGIGVSTIYYNQPLLLEMAASFHVESSHAGMVAVATQVGYAIGLLCFVPMGDIADRRGLMIRMYCAVAIALFLVSVAPTLPLLVLTSAVAGSLASVTHIALPIAPDLAPKGQRGRAIGIVMTGLLSGVLLGRTFAGWISEISHYFFSFAGWRTVFFVAAVVNALFVPAILKFMPPTPKRGNMRYADAMRSLWSVWREEPLLREACVMGGLIFAAFSSFWNTLAFLLGTHGLGAGVAGTFGLVGTAGALAASTAGRQSDRKGPRWVVSAGLSIFAIAFAGLWIIEGFHINLVLHLAIMAVCVILMDTGTQTVQIANQTRIFSLQPAARSRINTVYMVAYFTGGAIGSALSTIAWAHWHWNGVCAFVFGILALAALRHLTGDRSKYIPQRPSDPSLEMVLEG